MGYGARQQRLAGTCAAHHHDVALLDFHSVVVDVLLQSLIVVVDCHGEESLGVVLAYDILVEVLLDFAGLGYLLEGEGVGGFLVGGCAAIGSGRLGYLVGLLGAVVADEAVKPRDDEVDLALVAAAETTYFLLSHSSCVLI